MNDYWREEKRDMDRGIRYGVSRVAIIWIIVLVLALALGAGIWGLNVALSGVKGQGDGIIEKNSSQNWVDAQARFEENYADIEATQFKIAAASDALEAAKAAGEPTKTLEQTLQGTINYCASVVADYNADARNFLREDFKASDLPDQIDVELTCSLPAQQ